MSLSGPVTTYQRIEFPQSVKNAALKRSQGRCEGIINRAGERCPMLLNPANPAEFDHKIEAWEGGNASLDNCQVLGKKCCHVVKTAVNKTRRAKADRQSNEAKWLKPKIKWPKRRFS